MHKKFLKVRPPYDLKLTLKPSFLSSLFSTSHKMWTKVRGFLKGLVLVQKGPLIIYQGVHEVPLDVLKSILGLHLGPFETYLRYTNSELYPILFNLASCYPGVRLPFSENDFIWLFIAAVLSRRTDYEKNVLRWCSRIDKLTKGNPWLLLYISRDKILSYIGTSYQVKTLLDSLSSLRELLVETFSLSTDDPLELYEVSKDLSKKDPWHLRQLLLKCKYVGPKVADSIVMSVTPYSSFAPVDIHLLRVSTRLGILPPHVKLPQRNYCVSYTCYTCPYKDTCARGILLGKLDMLFGWYQTLTYLHGRNYCRSIFPKCHSCPLKDVCPKNK